MRAGIAGSGSGDVNWVITASGEAMRRCVIVLLWWSAALCSVPVLAQQPSPQPHEAVQRAAEDVIGIVKAYRASPDGKAGEVRDQIDAALGTVVDFRRIALNVMGPFDLVATESQRDEFVGIFRRAIINLYFQHLLALDAGNIQVAAVQSARRGKRAMVKLRVANLDRQHIELSFVMVQAADTNWVVHNLIYEGVNLGRTFQRQFEQAMLRFNDDVGKVIQSWESITRPERKPTGKDQQALLQPF